MWDSGGGQWTWRVTSISRKSVQPLKKKGGCKRLHAIEALAFPAPSPLADRCPSQEVRAGQSEDHARHPQRRPQCTQGQCSKHQDADEGESPATLQNYLAAAPLARNHRHWPLLGNPVPNRV